MASVDSFGRAPWTIRLRDAISMIEARLRPRSSSILVESPAHWTLAHGNVHERNVDLAANRTLGALSRSDFEFAAQAIQRVIDLAEAPSRLHRLTHDAVMRPSAASAASVLVVRSATESCSPDGMAPRSIRISSDHQTRPGSARTASTTMSWAREVPIGHHRAGLGYPGKVRHGLEHVVVVAVFVFDSPSINDDEA